MRTPAGLGSTGLANNSYSLISCIGLCTKTTGCIWKSFQRLFYRWRTPPFRGLATLKQSLQVIIIFAPDEAQPQIIPGKQCAASSLVFWFWLIHSDVRHDLLKKWKYLEEWITNHQRGWTAAWVKINHLHRWWWKKTLGRSHAVQELCGTVIHL